MSIDLHVHTTASDGTWSPTELVRAAAAKGVSVIAVTDHDTLDGVAEATAAGLLHGVEVLPGVEITTEVGPREFHLLGYFVRPEDEALQEQLATLKNARFERGREIVRLLNQLGVAISFEEVVREAQGGAVGRPHVARALFDRGLVSRSQEAFDRWLGKGRPAYVERYKLSPTEAIELLLRSRAIPVLAHPGLSGQDAQIEPLARAGLRGLEVYHTEHSPAMVAHYRALAERLGLLQTGGSDSHGPRGTRPIDVGGVVVPDELAERLKQAELAQR
ncbi:MAG: PHP domain-containing protein [Armatimonadetes bacterium]|nr:PHP domain-containing protein [Armatimonadota bacterium]NCO91040.1 PHP domain-containing protein [Armatimonadota bacterium]NCP32510.1 PHP domain-containing protein [Armatimonadota bacterium]NCQ26800.1 PHP domain-containing protein [Armatimonadota bacterium]NDK15028.1 PHP domain-containing protein [Armatimonadota bacterium]